MQSLWSYPCSTITSKVLLRDVLGCLEVGSPALGVYYTLKLVLKLCYGALALSISDNKTELAQEIEEYLI